MLVYVDKFIRFSGKTNSACQLSSCTHINDVGNVNKI